MKTKVKIPEICSAVQAAKISMMPLRAIIREFDEDNIRGWRMPIKGTRRRIPREALIRFMQENGVLEFVEIDSG